MPATESLNFERWTFVAISNAPAPGTTHLSSIAFLTALSPSLIASFIYAIVCSFGPLIKIVHDVGF